MLSLYHILLLLISVPAACISSGRADFAVEGEVQIAPSSYMVLAQRALTYQADFQWDASADLLAPHVEYHLPGPIRLVGKEDVLAYWRRLPQASRARLVNLSDFTILPVQTGRWLPPSKLPGVYVSVVFEQTVWSNSGREVHRAGCLYLHFNDDQLVDRLYSFNNSTE